MASRNRTRSGDSGTKVYKEMADECVMGLGLDLKGG